MPASNRADVLAVLEQQRAEIAQRYGATRLALFGSAARDELRPDSDIDVLVEFAGTTTLDGYFGLKDHLEAVLGRPVDLVTAKALKPRARAMVEQDLIDVA
jgi:predicted nucleotidyltransferase